MNKYFIFFFLIRILSVSAQNDSLWNEFCNRNNKDSIRWNSLSDFAAEFLFSNPDSSIQLAKLLQMETKNRKLPYFEMRANILLANAYTVKDEVNKAIPCFEKAIEYLETQNDKTKLGGAYCNMAVAYGNIFNYSKSEFCMKKALSVALETKNTKLTATTYNLYSNHYFSLSNYPKAIEYALLELKESEKNSQYDASGALINIGIYYNCMNNDTKAIEYLNQGLKAAKTKGNKAFAVNALYQMGSILFEQGSCDEAENYFKECFKLYEELGSKSGIANLYCAYGAIYSKRKKSSEAFSFFRKSLALQKETQNLSGEANVYAHIGDLYKENNDRSNAIKAYKSGLEVARQSKDLRIIDLHLEQLYTLYKAIGDKAKALDYYEEYVSIKDSLFNDDKQKAVIQNELKYEYEKQAARDSVTNEAKINEERLINAQAIKQQQTYTYGGMTGFALMLLVAGVSFRAYRNKRKANIIITSQKLLAEHQKEIIQEKQKEILDSLMYARRIQQALITNEKYINKEISRLKT